MEVKLQRLDHESLTQSPLRPKSDIVPAEEWGDETMKMQKPDAILEESGDEGQDEKMEKSIFSTAEKGKGKMEVDEEEGSDVEESGPSDDDDRSDFNDSDFTDDPLTELDVKNIIPGRVRPRIAVRAGTYRLEGESDEDDHTTCEDEEEEEEEVVEEEDEGNEEEMEKSEGSE